MDMLDRLNVLTEFYENSTVPTYYCSGNNIIWRNSAANTANLSISEFLLLPPETDSEFREISKDDHVYKIRYRHFEDGYFAEILQTKSFLLADFLSNFASLPDILSYISRSSSGRIFHALAPIRMLLEDSEQYEGLRYIDDISAGNYRLFRFSSLLQEYQTLSKLKEPFYEKVDFTKEAELLFSAVRQHAVHNDINFLYEISGTSIVGYGDIKRLNIALLQLISNAFYFTAPDNEVNVKMSVKEKELIFEIYDKGTGISPELMDKIFTPFYSYDPNTGDVAGGGLGLPYAALFAKTYGGSCSVTSSQNGSCVRLSLVISENSSLDKKFKNKGFSTSKFDYSSSDISPVTVYLSNSTYRER